MPDPARVFCVLFLVTMRCSLVTLSFDLLSIKGDNWAESGFRMQMGVSIWRPVLQAVATLPRLQELFMMDSIAAAANELAAACSSGCLQQRLPDQGEHQGLPGG